MLTLVFIGFIILTRICAKTESALLLTVFGRPSVTRAYLIYYGSIWPPSGEKLRSFSLALANVAYGDSKEFIPLIFYTVG